MTMSIRLLLVIVTLLSSCLHSTTAQPALYRRQANHREFVYSGYDTSSGSTTTISVGADPLPNSVMIWSCVSESCADTCNTPSGYTSIQRIADDDKRWFRHRTAYRHITSSSSNPRSATYYERNYYSAQPLVSLEEMAITAPAGTARYRLLETRNNVFNSDKFSEFYGDNMGHSGDYALFHAVLLYSKRVTEILDTGDSPYVDMLLSPNIYQYSGMASTWVARTSQSNARSKFGVRDDDYGVVAQSSWYVDVDCIMVTSTWSPCSVSCGGGTETRTHTQTQAPLNNGAGCSTESNLSRNCNQASCPAANPNTDCEQDVTYGTCSVTCGAGNQPIIYTETVASTGNGDDCVTTPSTRSCDAGACPIPDIDCVADLSSWSPCSLTCGPGTRTRTHDITTPRSGAGVDCVVPTLSEACEVVACPILDIDCDGVFTSWSTCSATCGSGTQSRTWTQTQAPQAGGAACIDTPLTQNCEITPCPIDCQGSFQPWESCSSPCGPGVRTRVFIETTAAQYSGANCVTSPLTEACNDGSCPIDCQGSFNAWTPCTSTCGTGIQTRVFTESRAAQFGGEPCVTMPQSQTCTAGNCPVDCYGYFTSWSACSLTCGPGGIQQRIFTTVTAAASGGDQCVTTPVSRVCQDQPACPVNCQGSHSQWSTCTTTCGDGSQSRQFSITTPAANGGNNCIQTDEVRTCNVGPCPVDCVATLSSWSECTATCGGGQRTRIHTITTSAANGGTQCLVPSLSELCNPQTCPAPGDCVGSFSSWSACSLSCGGGQRTRTFAIQTEAEVGGDACVATPVTEPCQTQLCPIDCEGSFSAYSSCTTTCGAGTQSRTHTVTQLQQHGGTPCIVTPIVRQCNDGACPIDCVGTFSTWSTCSSTCGAGTQSRTHTIVTPAANGGTVCTTTPLSMTCTVGECPVDCVQTTGQWSDCSKTCDGGIQIRDVIITQPPLYGGIVCVDSPTQQPCNEQSCPAPIDCIGAFGEWQECSVSCGAGQRTRTFTVTSAAINGGLQCVGLEQTTEDCGGDNPCAGDCVETIGEWSSCSVSCTQSRTHDITVDAVADGKQCSDADSDFALSRVCTGDACPEADAATAEVTQEEAEGGLPIGIIAGAGGGGCLLLLLVLVFCHRRKNANKKGELAVMNNSNNNRDGNSQNRASVSMRRDPSSGNIALGDDRDGPDMKNSNFVSTTLAPVTGGNDFGSSSSASSSDTSNSDGGDDDDDSSSGSDFEGGGRKSVYM